MIELVETVQKSQPRQLIVAYVRISTFEQNTHRQEDLIKSQFHVDTWFIDKISGKDYTLQTELQNLLQFVREGDLVVVESLSRLSRSTKDLLILIHQFEERKIDFISIKENITLNNSPIGKLIFHFVAAIAQFERENMKQRQREGIAIAKANGVYKGRRRIIKHPQFHQYYEKWVCKDNQYNLHHFAKDLNISVGTLSRFIKEHKILLKEQEEQIKEQEDQNILVKKEEAILKYQNQIEQIDEELSEILYERNESSDDLITFDDQSHINLVMNNISGLKAEVSKLNTFNINFLMMNKEIFQSLDCSLKKVKEDIEFIKKRIIK